MPEYLAPGVYVEEIERGPKPIEGVAPARPPSSAPPNGDPAGRGWSPATASTSAPSAASSPMRRTCRTRREGVLRQRRAPPTSPASAAPRRAGDGHGRGVQLPATGVGTAYNRVWVRIDEGTTKDGAGSRSVSA